MIRNQVGLVCILSIFMLTVLASFQNCSGTRFSEQASTVSSTATPLCTATDVVRNQTQSCSEKSFIRISVNGARDLALVAGATNTLLVEKSNDVNYKSSHLERISGTCSAETAWALPVSPFNINQAAVHVGLNQWVHSVAEHSLMNNCQWLLTVRGDTLNGVVVDSKIIINLVQSQGPVAGICSANLNTCAAGSFIDMADTSTDYRWTCSGSNAGVSVACSLPIPPSPVAGVCSTIVNTCVTGAFVDVADTSTENIWSCNGYNSGASVTCKSVKPIPAINGQCGASPQICLTGTSGPLTTSGNFNLWSCNGSNGGSSVSCSSERFCYASVMQTDCANSLRFERRYCNNVPESGPYFFGLPGGASNVCFTPMNTSVNGGPVCSYYDCTVLTVPTCYINQRIPCVD